MKKEQYMKLFASISNMKYGPLVVNLFDRLITFLIFASYPGLLLYMYYYDNSDLLRCIMVPAVSFGIVTVFRNVCNFKRPYEIYDFEPIIKKDTTAHSFPSRHVFSAFMIGMTYFVVDPMTSLDIFVLAALLAFLRVVGGVHFIRDVLVGAGLGVLAGIIGYFLI